MLAVEGRTIKEIDRLAMEEYGIPGIVLMEQAAMRVVEFMQKYIPMTSQSICVIVGKGNNGGDGMAVYRHLRNLGYHVQIIFVYPDHEYKGDALTQYHMIQRMGLLDECVIDCTRKKEVIECFEESDILVDALYGTGFAGRMPKDIWDLISAYNDSVATKIAIDIPSGLDANTGLGETVLSSDFTITLGAVKIGLFLDQEKRAGQIYLGDIGLPSRLLSRFSSRYEVLIREDVLGFVAKRKAYLHKGSCGKILVVGGKKGLTGAIYLAAEGAVRSGAGLVSCLVPEDINEILEQKLTEAMTIPVSTEMGYLTDRQAERLVKEAMERDVLVMGPGLGRDPGTLGLIEAVMNGLSLPSVMDADALFHLANIPTDRLRKKDNWVLTPHEGEAARLLGKEVGWIKEHRQETMVALYERYGGVILLKGSRTLIYDGKHLAINTTGNPGMATGGSGDVLSGMIGALLGQGLDGFSAAKVGAYLHGLAGDLAAGEWSEEAMKAGDITQTIAKAFLALKDTWKQHTYLNKMV